MDTFLLYADDDDEEERYLSKFNEQKKVLE